MLLNFQIIDISHDDVCYDEDNKYNRDFTITFYGKTQEGENVVCNVLGYEPYFYMRVPDSWTESFCKNFIEKTIAGGVNFNSSEVYIKHLKKSYESNL